MPIPSSYLTSAKNLPDILDRMQRGQVPPKFTYEYLKQLGFPSSNDRPVIPILKALGFLDQAGVPRERYRRYKDPKESGFVMAEGLREAYKDVFSIDEKAYGLSVEELNGLFARLSDKGESVSNKMAMTFRTLAGLADWSEFPQQHDSNTPDEASQDERNNDHHGEGSGQRREVGGGLVLRHDVHIHLPITENIKVYDAIFRSLQENLAA